MSRWKEVSLAEVCSPPQYGAIASAASAPPGPRFVRQTDIVTGRIDWITVPYADLDDVQQAKYELSEGDLLISRLGAGVGNAARMDRTTGAVFAGYLVRFRVNKALASDVYVGHQLQSQQWRDHVRSFGSGAAQPTLNAKQMGAFRFLLPPLPEQERIAGVLGAFDDLIDNNVSLIDGFASAGAAIVAGADSEQEATLRDVCSVIESGRRPKGGRGRNPFGNALSGLNLSRDSCPSTSRRRSTSQVSLLKP